MGKVNRVRNNEVKDNGVKDNETKDKKRILFVCQRYGLEVNGGAELYCREVAEHLTSVYDVTVYTTCAVDYVSWANAYKPGQEEINGVHVRRFKNQKERRQDEFGEVHTRVMTNPAHSDEEELEWIDKQGPYCPELIEELAKVHDRFTAVLFMTYLYYTTSMGIVKDFDNALLIPTLHDEPPVYLRYFDKVFKYAKGIAWNTPEERDFAYRRFPFTKNTPSVMTGIGIEGPAGKLPELPESVKDAKYIVYAGRIDESKGCGDMFQYFQRYKREHSGDIKLVLMGKAVMPVPKDRDIISLGFVSEEMKFAVMANAVALVLFSHFESLSMVVLESMLMGRPVLVTEHCEVLKGHCVRSNAGLYFANYYEFAATLEYLLTHEAEYEVMRENGKKYVEENYRWDVIVRRYAELIEGLKK